MLPAGAPCPDRNHQRSENMSLRALEEGGIIKRQELGQREKPDKSVPCLTPGSPVHQLN